MYNYNMNYYGKYIKYKSKYLKLKQKNIIQNGGNENIILYNNDFVNLSRKIKDSKKDIFMDIILWISQDSKHNKNTTKNDNGFCFLTNSANLVFNKNMDGFYFVNNIKASKDEIFELTFIIKNIIELEVTKNFKITDLNFSGKNNIYERIEHIKKYFISFGDNDLESISEQKNKITEEVRSPLETIKHETTEVSSPLETRKHETTEVSSPLEKTQNDSNSFIKPSKQEKYMIPNFEPDTFYPSDYIVGMYEPIHYKKDKNEFSSESSETSDDI